MIWFNFQSEGGVIYTFKKPATEWGLKKLLRAELEDCQEGTHYMILYGIHGSGIGFLLKHDPALVHAFGSGIETIKRRQTLWFPLYL